MAVRKEELEPLERYGYCQGCQQHDKRLFRISESRYRCSDCGKLENRGEVIKFGRGKLFNKEGEFRGNVESITIHCAKP